MKNKLISYIVSKNYDEIILKITYKTDILPKHIIYTYKIITLINLLINQKENDFMNYQFKYMYEQINNPNAREEFLIETKFQIRKDILKLIKDD